MIALPKAITAVMSLSLPMVTQVAPTANQQDVTHFYDRKKGGKK